MIYSHEKIRSGNRKTGYIIFLVAAGHREEGALLMAKRPFRDLAAYRKVAGSSAVDGLMQL
jgi:hypothetical protein